MTDQELDRAGLYGAVMQAMRQDGYAIVTDTDVAEIHQALLAGREPSGLVSKAIARHLRLLEGGSV